MCRNSALNSSMVRSLTCCPATAPVGVTPNSTCPPCWFRKAHTVMAASRRVSVVSLNSNVSDSPAAARAVTLSLSISGSCRCPKDVVSQFVLHAHPRLDERSESVAHKGLGIISWIGKS